MEVAELTSEFLVGLSEHELHRLHGLVVGAWMLHEAQGGNEAFTRLFEVAKEDIAKLIKVRREVEGEIENA